LESDNDRPEIAAFLEMEHLVRNVGEALAGFRRRALAAESQLRELGVGAGTGGSGKQSRASGKSGVEMEAQVDELRARLEQATERTQQMLDRVRFLRQQQNQGE
jgi:hypothetical protein